MTFWIYCSISVKNDIGRSCLESVGCFRLYSHFHNINSAWAAESIDRMVVTRNHKQLLVEMGVLQTFLPGLALDSDLPDLCLPNN
jgi:hypothetical protein